MMQSNYFSKAVYCVQNGEIIVYPTDTLYGLGADIFDDFAVRKVFEIKKRPFDQPISVAVYSLEDMEDIAVVNDQARRLVEEFLPGPLTLVLNKKSIVSDLVTGGLEKIAVRIPDNEIALKLLSVAGPITATSANIHGQETPRFIEDIKSQFQNEDIAVYIDVGRLDGEPSTIVDMTGEEPIILREGILTKEDLLDAIKNGL